MVSDGRTTIYHAGDTGLFEDMKLIGQVFQPDYALLPIGGRFTMDPRQAVIAVDMIKPRKAAIPIHFNTWDMIRVDPQEFVKELRTRDTRRFYYSQASPSSCRVMLSENEIKILDF